MSRDVTSSPVLNKLSTSPLSQTACTGSAVSTLATVVAQTIAQLLVKELNGQTKLSQTYTNNDLGGLTEPTASEPSESSHQTKSDGTLKLTSKTSPQQVKDFLGPLSQRPKMALTQTGAPYYVLGTFQNEQRQTMVRTSNPNGEGGFSDMPMDQFMKEVKTLDTFDQGAGTEVTAQENMPAGLEQQAGVTPGASYKFNGVYQDPKSGEMMMSLTGKDGAVTVPAALANVLFGRTGAQKLTLNGLNPAAQGALTRSDVGGPSKDGGSFGIAQETQPKELGNWLQQGKGPQVAADKTGKMWVVDRVTRGDGGEPQVQLEDPNNPDGETQTLPLSEFTKNFNSVDRGQSGRGSQLKTADGSKATFLGLGTDPKTGKALVHVQCNGPTQALSLEQFAKTYGKAALRYALDDSLSEPSKPRFDDLQTSDGTSNTGDSAGAVDADPSDPAGNINQGRVGDCFFLASLGSLEQKNPQALQQMIRPSKDGDAHHYDVRFYAKDPNTGGTKPVWVTVDDKLPVNSQGKFSAAKPTTGGGLGAIAPALIEKAYAKFNQQYHVNDNDDTGYDGITGGNPAVAMQTLTGQTSQTVPSQDSASFWQGLQQANQGTPVVLGTSPSNSPQAGVAPNVVQSHAYTVVKTYTDPKTGEAMVTLRNPWGKNTDASGKPIAGTNGIFSMPLSEVQKYFPVAFVGGGNDAGTRMAS